ncbi:MAG: hypothetical protein WCC06_04225 [Candidatus Aminicenantales bacterium]
MKSGEKERSRYFQAIARAFFAWRGAPFFLSAKDLDLISTWEDMGIPLSVVLEGVEKAFSDWKKRISGKSKVRSLSLCQTQVLRAFEQYRERRVGGKKRVTSREDKRKKVLAEVRRFLEQIPPDIHFIKGIYLEAKKKASCSPADEEGLEQMDEKIEELLFSHCPEDLRAGVRTEMMAENRGLEKEGQEKVLKIKLVRRLRKKFNIPYLSFYYY